MNSTPETDDLARGNHVVPTEFAQQLERERDEAREEIEMLGIRYAAAEMHHETNMQAVTKERDEAREQRDRLTEVIEAATVLIAAKGRHNTMLAYDGLRESLQSLTPNAEL
jgi:hypothetical protein